MVEYGIEAGGAYCGVYTSVPWYTQLAEALTSDSMCMKVGLLEASLVLEMVLMDTLMPEDLMKLAARVGSLQGQSGERVGGWGLQGVITMRW
jgi:hypothetical protein